PSRIAFDYIIRKMWLFCIIRQAVYEHISFFTFIPGATSCSLDNGIGRCKFCVQAFTSDIQAYLNCLSCDYNKTFKVRGTFLFCTVFLKLLPNRRFFVLPMCLDKSRV